MKKTLLEMTQDILTAMEDDEVNSISDTSSSYSVATTIVKCYYELVDELDLPGMETLTQLEPLSDTNRPNYFKMPDNLIKLGWIRYNGYEIQYMHPKEFITHVGRRSEGLVVQDFSGVELLIDGLTAPTYWTSFDDTYIVMDSFNGSEDSTLQGSKSTAFVEKEYVFNIADETIPRLPARLFPTLISKATALCFINFKQVANASEEQGARRGLVRHQNDMRRVNQLRPIDRLPNYAYRRGTSRKSTSRR